MVGIARHVTNHYCECTTYKLAKKGIKEALQP